MVLRGYAMSEKWDQNSNCYGYAVKVKGCGSACPGGVNKQPSESTANYAERLRQGVLADGGDRVSENTSVNWPFIPVNASGNCSLVVMLVGDAGFHFLRRERTRIKGPKRWKWKQGCLDNEVVTKVMYNDNWTEITKTNLMDFINNPGLYAPNNGMPQPTKYGYFFNVDSWGFKFSKIGGK